MRMPFGRFAGVLVADLPEEYLLWLQNLPDLRPPLRAAVDAERRARIAARSLAIASDPLPAEIAPMVEEMIAAGYRTLAIRHHPDHGGATAAMQAVNLAMEWLRRQVRRPRR
jgi:hypothetical protein